jgi:succinate dehydrogenase / fumarate reductase cytochrome b subunit
VAEPPFVLLRIATSTIGLKIIMAISGVALVGFVAFHMLGHLQVFVGEDAYNAYAGFLYGLGGLLWVARGGLLVLLVLHVWAAMKLRKRNAAARPVAYTRLERQVTTPYAGMMLLTGAVVLAYLIYHLAHFSFGLVHPDYFHAVDALGRRNVYLNFVKSFQSPVITIIYVVASLLLAAHLAHAVGSMFRTLGLSVGRYRAPLDRLGPAVGLVVGVGFIAPPVAILLGIVR